MGDSGPVQDAGGAASRLMTEAAAGDRGAADRLLPLVYGQLRREAQAALAAERDGHTLTATALVHEAYLRLVGPREIAWRDRAHFYAAASEAMRRVLLDHARARGAVKRGGGAGRVTLTGVADLAAKEPGEIVRFDEAFQRLESEWPEPAAVVRMRFFAGLSVEQTAAALDVSTSTVDRRWAFARAWLFQRLEESGKGGAG